MAVPIWFLWARDFSELHAIQKPSGPTATAILSRYAVTQRNSLYTLSHYVFQNFEGCLRRIALHPCKGPCSTTTFSTLKGGVALQVASWKVSRYNGVLQLHCRLPRYSGALSSKVARLAILFAWYRPPFLASGPKCQKKESLWTQRSCTALTFKSWSDLAGQCHALAQAVSRVPCP